MTAATARKKKPVTPPAVELVPPVTVATFDLHPADGERFARAVRVASMFASADDCRPILTGIHVVSDGAGSIVIEATDSYRLVRLTLGTMTAGDDPAPAFDVIVRAKWLLANVPKRRQVVGFGLEFSDTQATVRDYQECTVASVKLTEAHVPFPNIDRLFTDPSAHVEGLAEPTGFNPKYLFDMLKACDVWGSPWHIGTRVSSIDPMKPVRFDVATGDGDMAAMLMPVRLP